MARTPGEGIFRRSVTKLSPDFLIPSPAIWKNMPAGSARAHFYEPKVPFSPIPAAVSASAPSARAASAATQMQGPRVISAASASSAIQRKLEREGPPRCGEILSPAHRALRVSRFRSKASGL